MITSCPETADNEKSSLAEDCCPMKYYQEAEAALLCAEHAFSTDDEPNILVQTEFITSSNCETTSLNSDFRQDLFVQ